MNGNNHRQKIATYAYSLICAEVALRSYNSINTKETPREIAVFCQMTRIKIWHFLTHFVAYLAGYSDT